MPRPVLKTLNEAEFKEWIATYPNKLERDVFGAAEPPLVTWNDFTRAPYWPDSVVASCKAGSGIYNVIADLNAPVITSSTPDAESLTDRDGKDVQVGDAVSVSWGWSSVHGEDLRTHTVTKNDVGTPYERWGISGCANNLRSMSFVKVS